MTGAVRDPEFRCVNEQEPADSRSDTCHSEVYCSSAASLGGWWLCLELVGSHVFGASWKSRLSLSDNGSKIKWFAHNSQKVMNCRQYTGNDDTLFNATEATSFADLTTQIFISSAGWNSSSFPRYFYCLILIWDGSECFFQPTQCSAASSGWWDCVFTDDEKVSSIFMGLQRQIKQIETDLIDSGLFLV